MTKPRTGDALVDAVVTAAHRLRNQANEGLRECGLSLARLKVMDSLEAQPRRMREVSDALGVVPRTLTDTVDGLETEGLVRRGGRPGGWGGGRRIPRIGAPRCYDSRSRGASGCTRRAPCWTRGTAPARPGSRPPSASNRPRPPPPPPPNDGAP